MSDPLPDAAPLPDGPLDAMEQRILGALLEKQTTVPASYPLSVNGLRTACNQATSREPVTAYAETELEECCRRLKRRGLIRIVHADRGPRTLKYHQLLDEVLGLDAAERAIVTVLLLRGAQAPGELKTRTERLHPFADRDEVAARLAGLAGREVPLVRELDKRPGQHDRRWIHLLGPVPGADEEAPAAPTASEVDRESVLRGGAEARDARIIATYNTVAGAYSDAFADELARKPFDRWLLDRLVATAGAAPVADVGTGPGHVAAYLREAGATDVVGFDRAPGMVAEARRRYAGWPGLTFEPGEASSLPKPRLASGWGAIACWYGLVHHAPSEFPRLLRGMVRTLRPGGCLAFAVHAGDEVRHASEWLGHQVDVDFVLHDRDAVLRAARDAGLQRLEWYLRSPLAGVEVETERFYVLGHAE